jgi:hypothetical protein
MRRQLRIPCVNLLHRPVKGDARVALVCVHVSSSNAAVPRSQNSISTRSPDTNVYDNAMGLRGNNLNESESESKICGWKKLDCWNPRITEKHDKFRSRAGGGCT